MLQHLDSPPAPAASKTNQRSSNGEGVFRLCAGDEIITIVSKLIYRSRYRVVVVVGVGTQFLKGRDAGTHVPTKFSVVCPILLVV